MMLLMCYSKDFPVKVVENSSVVINSNTESVKICKIYVCISLNRTSEYARCNNLMQAIFRGIVTRYHITYWINTVYSLSFRVIEVLSKYNYPNYSLHVNFVM
jgi:hypothetical protein